MYTVTFYSYRGGVGRTTALANVAVDLALRGRKVLVVDFDLEAPSLPSFVPLRPEDGAHPGLVEFIAEYLRLGKSPDIRNYVYQANPIDEDCAEVWVMPAGRGDDDYWRAFHGINWKELYDLQDGFVLFEDIKFQWRESFHPDYVLIDARAGINDRLAICTRQLPDAVVMMFTPDSAGHRPPLRRGAPGAGDQAGFQRVVGEVVGEVVTESLASGRRRIAILFVASKVPDLDGEEPHWYDLCVFNTPQNADKPEEAAEVVLFKAFRELLGQSEPDFQPEAVNGILFNLAATIPHTPELLLDRHIIPSPCPRERHDQLRIDELGRFKLEVVPHPHKRLARAYRNLANSLIRSNCIRAPVGARAFLKMLQENPNLGVGSATIELLDWWYDCAAQLDQVIRNFGDDPDILAQAASCLFLAERFDRAMETLDQAIEQAVRLNHPLDSLLWQRASYRRRLQQFPGAVDDLLQLLEAPAPQQSGHSDEDAGSPELDTTPLDTADPLTRDFPGIDPYVASAIQQLRQLASDKVPEALQKPRIQQLSPEARQALIADVPTTPPSIEQNPERLFRAKQWRAVIALLEPRVAQPSATTPADLLYLAMAHWGCGNDARSIEISQSLKEMMLKGSDLASMGQNLDAESLQGIPLLSLVFWRAGDPDTAKGLLDRCDELLTEVSGDNFFSYWRFHSVNRDQFQEDCDSLRRMIEGRAAIHPVFLGKELS